MRKNLYIFIFAFLGGSIRGLLSYCFSINLFATIIFINVIGSFLLAFITGIVPKLSEVSSEVLAGISTGLIGGFTTFSTFSVQFMTLFKNSEIGLAFIYLIVSLFLSLSSALVGYRLGTKILK
ncbi:fluoride efflux transporter FluC [Apilactobacillus ozensis]|uniref:fluoride efflux transporter FluC n=1 Tax=Apilactobacillus ozensis TaxID=866801 RepID=UPI00200B0AF3|nr:CrcB family protein [Apilactobacillus ozensis]MCK8607703.1 CrcB family protein [Apilactobacillus ozensis]